MSAEKAALHRLAPGTMLSMNSAPEVGFWLVLNCKVETFPGPWCQLSVLLLGNNTIVTVEKESSAFFERWTVHER